MDELSKLIIEFYERLSAWEIETVKGEGYSLPQMHAIEMIGHHPGIRMVDLARRLGITTGTLTSLIDRLEKNSLVLREPHETDRRSYVLRLSKSGKKLFAQHDAQHRQLTENLCQDMHPDEMKKARHIFRELIGRFEQR